MNKRFFLANLLVPVVVVALAVGVRAAFAAWAPPTAAPTGGQPPPPINTGSALQRKAGELKVGGIFTAESLAYMGQNALVGLMGGSIDGSDLFWIGGAADGRLIVGDDLLVKDRLGVGFAAVDPAYHLDVAGAMRLRPISAPSVAQGVTYVDSTGAFKCSNAAGTAFEDCGGLWTQSGTNIHPNDLSWNVGIGTTSPGIAKTYISNDGTNVGLYVGNGTPFGQAKIELDGPAATHLWVAESGSGVFFVASGGAGYFAGNVGIGTTDPSLGGRVGSRFTVVSGGTAFAAAANSTTPSFAINTEGGAWRMYDWAAGGWNWDLYANNGSVRVNNSLFFGGNLQHDGRMHIQAGENIFLNPWGGGTVYIGGGGGPGNLYAIGNVNAASFTGRDATFVYNGGTHVLRNDSNSVYLWPWGTGAASSNIILGGGGPLVGLNSTGWIYEQGNRVCTAANGLCGGGLRGVAVTTAVAAIGIGINSVTVSCPAGYTATGGGHFGNATFDYQYYQDYPSGAGSWVCSRKQNTVSSSCYVKCITWW